MQVCIVAKNLYCVLILFNKLLWPVLCKFGEKRAFDLIHWLNLNVHSTTMDNQSQLFRVGIEIEFKNCPSP